MKVKDLIKELEKYDQELEIVREVFIGNGTSGDYYVKEKIPIHIGYRLKDEYEPDGIFIAEQHNFICEDGQCLLDLSSKYIEKVVCIRGSSKWK
jgi:hypothetical protein